jgi:hypothetical protein
LAAKAARIARLRAGRSREEDFDYVAGLPEVGSSPGGSACRRVQLCNPAQTLGMCRPKRPLAGGAFRNHRAQVHQEGQRCDSLGLPGDQAVEHPSQWSQTSPPVSGGQPASADEPPTPAPPPEPDDNAPGGSSKIAVLGDRRGAAHNS